jgi:glycosyltransferase involved in cell wall biosynthesis
MRNPTAAQPTARLLYLMHVDWRWIKQRPHFLAEELERASIRVLVLFIPSIRSRHFSKNPSSVRRIPLPVVPRWMSTEAKLWNQIVGRLIVALAVALFRPTAVWITFPTLIQLLPDRRRRRLPLIYDAMDIAEAFFKSPNDAATIRAYEHETVHAATLITCSSPSIRDELINKFGAPAERIAVVRNAYDSRRCWSPEPRPRKTGDHYRLAYIGTISSWLDLDALVGLLSRLPAVEVDLYGPSDVALPAIARLNFRGVIPHHRLQTVAAATDCFIMPFVITDLVRGVDPVKLYEYLAMRRPVICRWYEGLTPFASFVHFYHDAAELAAIVERLMSDSGALDAHADKRLDSFLAINDWCTRVAAIVPFLQPPASL